MMLLRNRLTLLFVLTVVGLPLRADLVNGIRAVVHDAVITYGEVESDVALLAGELHRQYGRQPDVFQQMLAKARNDSLEAALQHQLMLNDFKTAGYSLPESIIDEVVQEEIRARFGDRVTATKTLQAQGITRERWRQQARERFIVRQLQARNVQQSSIISPHKIETYYLANQDNYKVQEQVKLRMIVLNKQPDKDASPVPLAEEILSKLKEGAAFSEMAGIHSEGSQRTQGGDWGWIERSVLRRELADVAFALQPGELSGVIDTPQAVYLMLVEDKRPAHNRPLVEVREDIERILATRERERRQKEYIEKLRKKTFVRYF